MSRRERRARTAAGMSLAMAMAGLTFGAWLGHPLLMGLGLGGAIATVIAAVWYFYERGKRLTHMDEARSEREHGKDRD